jgi:plastocyanin
MTVLALALIGCDRKPANQPASATAGPVRIGTAIIRGGVTLAGKPPVMATLPNQPCHAGAGPLKEESVVADASGHLQNVIVYLEDAPGAAPATHLPPVVIDQVNCQYVPHVVALRAGQTLHVTTSDPTLHNVHGLCTVNDAFNFALVAKGQSKDLAFTQPERFPLRCDVHPWMKAFVQVFPHPWFAVTGADGSFEIRGVPSGTYTLVAWQEKYGEQHVPVTVADGQTLTAPITFRSGL